MINTQSKVPQLRFPEFKLGQAYETYRFEDIFFFSSGKNIKQAEASPEYEIPCVRYGELYHMYDEVITKTINKTNLCESDLTFSEGNEILLPSAGEDPLDIGSASALTLQNVAIGRTINVLRPKGGIAYSHIYMSYYINKKLRRKISTLARGASISNVYNSDLKTLKSNLPEIQEQNKVASFTTTVDKKISLLKQKHEQLVQYKKGVMQQLFNQQLRFKDDEGQNFPDWKKQEIGEYLVEYKERVDANTELPVLTSSRKGLVSQRDYYNDSERSNEGEYGVLPLGYFTYRHMSDDSTFKFNVNKKWEKGAISKEYPVFTTKGMNSYFLEQHLNNGAAFKRFAIAQKLGGTRTRLYFKSLKKLKLNLPSEREQDKIAIFLESIDKKINLAQQQIEQTQAYKQGLLQQMFV
jgi:type I restriction enzyme S subunit